MADGKSLRKLPDALKQPVSKAFGPTRSRAHEQGQTGR